MSLMEQELAMNLSSNGDSARNSSFIVYLSGEIAASAIFLMFSKITAVATLAVYVFAMVANTTIILVLLRSGFKLTSNICFFALAIADLLNSVIWFLWLIQIHNFIPHYVSVHFVSWSYLLAPCGDAIHSIGSWITTIITLERLCCIMFPLKVKLIFTRTSILCLILGAFTYEIIAMSVYFYGQSIIISSYSGNSPPQIHLIRYGIYLKSCAIMAGSFGPNYVLFALIIIGTIALVIAFKRSVQTRKSLVATQDTKTMSTKEIRLIKSVIAVCVIYIVSCTPLNVYESAGPLGLTHLIHPIFHLLAYFARSFNHAINIFVYLSMNSTFRAHFRSLCCFCTTERFSASK